MVSLAIPRQSSGSTRLLAQRYSQTYTLKNLASMLTKSTRHWLTIHCLESIIFSFYPKIHTQAHTLLIVFCVSNCVWCLLLALWCPGAPRHRLVIPPPIATIPTPGFHCCCQHEFIYSNKLSRGGAFCVKVFKATSPS